MPITQIEIKKEGFEAVQGHSFIDTLCWLNIHTPKVNKFTKANSFFEFIVKGKEIFISYIPYSKYIKFKEMSAYKINHYKHLKEIIELDKQRVVAKSGRVLKKIFDAYTDKEVEVLVGKINAVFNKENIEIKSDICNIYHEDNYYSDKGSLGESCMRYYYCQNQIAFYEYIGTKVAVIYKII